ncbi:MAG: AMP-binding protein [Pseudomonadota bacterium]|nr:AMP-binding protein [Pseudomonadota bacterium]MDP1903237.1 AMP-binding protein [Pseudomonadota bacterium]MDP2352746.1 AMP-binding protein [Pseudomonadota bacterium]
MKLAELMTVGRPPEYPVAWLEGRLIEWAEFHARVAKLSHALATRPEQEWLLACTEPFDFAVALFAVWHAGRRALLPPSLREGAITEARRQADGVLADPGTWPEYAPENLALAPLDPVRCGLDLFTSGSSGKPKRVSKHLAQFEAEVAALERLWGGRDAGPVLATVPHHHIYGLLFRLLWPLASGRPFDNQTCTAPEFLLARLEQLGPGRVVSSPSQLARMHELIPLDSLAGRTTQIISSGGPLDAATAARFQAALGEAPLEILGSTETGGIAWRIQDHDDAWTPFPEVAVSVADDVTNSAALTLVSPFLPDTTPLTTGDAAELLEDGRFHLLGRLDRIVKIEEKRLSLAEMEARLSGHPWVREAALVVLNNRRQRLGAVLVLDDAGRRALENSGRAACAQTLRGYLARWFDAVLLPRHWRYPDALPYNERGKLAAADLVRQFETTEFRHE